MFFLTKFGVFLKLAALFGQVFSIFFTELLVTLSVESPSGIETEKVLKETNNIEKNIHLN